jgi:hypothetical protein
MYMMRQSIQQSTCQSLIIAEDLWPVRKRQIGSHYQRCQFITLTEEAKQMFGTYSVKRHIAKLIDDNEITPFYMAFQTQNGFLLSGFNIGINKHCGDKELYVIASPASCSAYRNCKMAFADAGRTCKYDIVSLINKLAH